MPLEIHTRVRVAAVQHSGERRAAAILSREEWRAAAGENSCRTPLRAGDRAHSATLGQISPAKDATGQLTPDRRATRSQSPPSPPMTRTRLRVKTALTSPAQRVLELSTERPPRSARRRGRAHYAQDGQRIAVATAGHGRTPASGHRPDPATEVTRAEKLPP